MIENKNLKQLLDEASAMIPELLETTTSKDEGMAALLAVLSMRLDWLETIAEDIHHPDFEENFTLLRLKIFELVKMLMDKV